MPNTKKHDRPKSPRFAPKKHAADDRGVSLRLPTGLVATLDALAVEHRTTRTEVIERLVLWALELCSDELEPMGATEVLAQERKK